MVVAGVDLWCGLLSQSVTSPKNIPMGLENIRIVLVQPAGPLNVGSIARIMKNMGLSQLILVDPQCDRLDPEAVKMSVHAVDILENARQVPSLRDALAGCHKAIATTGRSRSLPTNLEHPRLALPWLLDTPSALIFGPEDRGLNNAELKYAQRFVQIPSSDAYSSLNLAQAVGVCAYELYQSERGIEGSPAPATQIEAPPDSVPVPIDQLEEYYRHLEALLLDIGYLYPHTAERRMEKFRRLYNRARLDRNEVAMLRGILRQVEWAIAQNRRVGGTLKTSQDSPEGSSSLDEPSSHRNRDREASPQENRDARDAE
jgi:tRNA/rRNA methyltransferase